jgi:hypothetical protein
MRRALCILLIGLVGGNGITSFRVTALVIFEDHRGGSVFQILTTLIPGLLLKPDSKALTGVAVTQKSIFETRSSVHGTIVLQHRPNNPIKI